jgi:transposase
LEYGVTIPLGALKVKSELRSLIDNKENELTVLTRELMQDLYDELVDVEERLKKMEKKIKLVCKNSEQCQRILKIPGIGELTATAIVASVPNAGFVR